MYQSVHTTEELSIHQRMVHTSELRCMVAEVCSEGADVAVFQVADAPTYGYVYTLPILTTSNLSYFEFEKSKRCLKSA